MNKSEQDLLDQVLAELGWEPSLDLAQIGVTVHEPGGVTLRGTLSSYAEKLDAERAAKRVTGVKTLVSKLEVRPLLATHRTDQGIARAVAQALEWNVAVPHERVKTRVSGGWVTLEGQVSFQFQRAAAEAAITHLPGVRGVLNHITIRPTLRPDDIKSRIEAALRRNAGIDARSIEVEIRDGAVTLRGHVRSWAERAEAELAAWAAPGVSEVTDELLIAS